ncbi:hypothetical protein GA0074695_6398 [Micromonospora viridifaciens]|uniref:Uncharacterized protein n=1 Tax=Micromonospora viridifaciens TaxID=1881 RepID=A0A1C4ZZW6_MICVI|nr:hypothetical protein [Micromonospora viridifaciens]SCF38510.1 hypothetical protein GA0074695_6398 [Micromonospora viridifaciens]
MHDNTPGGSTAQPERIEIDTPNIPLSPTMPFTTLNGYSLDNVNATHQPTHLQATPGGAGAETEWDASTLDNAITWLDEHADFLHKQSYQMEEDIRKWMRNPSGDAAAAAGGSGQKSPLGSFERATALASKHAALYQATQQNLRTLAKELWKAAHALQEVKQGYETAEERNRMNADQMRRTLTGASDHDLQR